jgi:PEGA domain-containing protein
VQTIDVSLVPNPKAIYPGADRAELRLDIRPKNASVFVNNLYVGHGSEFGGRFHSLLVSPAKHQLKVTMKGYRTYEMDINPGANEKTQMKIVLEPGADPQP